jgi:uncharacterized protein with HEPN domain
MTQKLLRIWTVDLCAVWQVVQRGIPVLEAQMRGLHSSAADEMASTHE